MGYGPYIELRTFVSIKLIGNARKMIKSKTSKVLLGSFIVKLTLNVLKKPFVKSITINEAKSEINIIVTV
jgi:hypothetical protein